MNLPHHSANEECGSILPNGIVFLDIDSLVYPLNIGMCDFSEPALTFDNNLRVSYDNDTQVFVCTN
jgi:hypothetical protein